jgi:hypothetical protein
MFSVFVPGESSLKKLASAAGAGDDAARRSRALPVFQMEEVVVRSSAWHQCQVVIRGLDPRIHLLGKSSLKKMDCRVKSGNDGEAVRQ